MKDLKETFLIGWYTVVLYLITTIKYLLIAFFYYLGYLIVKLSVWMAQDSSKWWFYLAWVPVLFALGWFYGCFTTTARTIIKDLKKKDNG